MDDSLGFCASALKIGIQNTDRYVETFQPFFCICLKPSCRTSHTHTHASVFFGTCRYRCLQWMSANNFKRLVACEVRFTTKNKAGREWPREKTSIYRFQKDGLFRYSLTEVWRLFVVECILVQKWIKNKR